MCVCVCVCVCARALTCAYAHGLQVEIFSLSSWSNINFRSFLHSEDNFLSDSAHGQTVLCIFGGFCQKKSFLLLSYQQKILSLSGLTGNKCPFLVHLYTSREPSFCVAFSPPVLCSGDSSHHGLPTPSSVFSIHRAC